MRTSACSSSKRNSARARAVSVLPTPVGPRKRKCRAAGSGPAGRRARRGRRSATASIASSWPTTRSRRRVLHVHQLLDLALQQLADRDAGPAADDLGDVLLVDLFLDQRAPVLAALAHCLLRRLRSCCSSSADLVLEARGALPVGAQRGLLELGRGRVELAPGAGRLRLSSSSSCCQRASSSVACSFRSASSLLDALEALAWRRRPSPCAGPRARSRAA